MPGGAVILGVGRRVHAHEFEDEVGHPGEVEEDDDALAEGVFGAADPHGEEEEEDCDDEGGDCEGEFVGVAMDDDEELDGEADEEEEVEF